jgi:hypothetical protein
MIKIDNSGKSALKRTQKRLIFLVVRFDRPIIDIMTNPGAADSRRLCFHRKCLSIRRNSPQFWRSCTRLPWDSPTITYLRVVGNYPKCERSGILSVDHPESQFCVSLSGTVAPEDTRPMRLDATDPVYRCIKKMRRLIRPLKGNSLLVNGKIEMLLKSIIGVAWESEKPNDHAFVMDKRFKVQGAPVGIGGLDILAFENRKPKFWIETKCSFFEDSGNGRKSANAALDQTELTFQRLHPHLATCPVYIVHFLNSVPNNCKAWPCDDFVIGKFPKRRCFANKFTDAEKHRRLIEWRHKRINVLRAIYESHHKNRRFDGSAIIPISHDPFVLAIVVRLSSPNTSGQTTTYPPTSTGQS